MLKVQMELWALVREVQAVHLQHVRRQHAQHPCTLGTISTEGIAL